MSGGAARWPGMHDQSNSPQDRNEPRGSGPRPRHERGQQRRGHGQAQRPGQGQGPRRDGRDDRGGRRDFGGRGPQGEARGGGPRGPREGGDRRATPVAPAVVQAGVPHGSREGGWLPDLVYTGEKFESGLAFFADAQGRITRFSREPADLAAARRLPGQAALPGLVDAHSQAWRRLARGRLALPGKGSVASAAAGREVLEFVAGRLGDEEVFDVARMVFLELLLGGVTCLGEFHFLHQRAGGATSGEGGGGGDAAWASREVIRAAHDVGIRIALLRVAYARGGYGAGGAPAARFATPAAEQFVRETEALRVAVEKEFSADEAWLGVGVHSLAAVPLEQAKAIATYARAQRMRFHARVSTTAEENAACVAEFGKSPVALLAEHGMVDKRFTAVGAAHASEEEIRLLGAARAMVTVCPSAAFEAGERVAPIEKLLAASAGVALGSDGHAQTDLLREARLLEYHLRAEKRAGRGMSGDAAKALFHAATVTGARSLGATTGALEVGRPADFFTVNLGDASVAGADAESLLGQVVFGLERRAIRDVWVGARQRIAGGRHVNQGAIVGRFVEVQRRVWGGDAGLTGT